MSVRANLKSVLSTLPANCKLIAVTKTHPEETILEAYQAGHRMFGENKVQELVGKYELLPKDIDWHLIGHLQTNKVRHIVPFVSLIHSVDSVKLLLEIHKQALKYNRVVDCLLQVHISQDETKFGLSEAEVEQLISSTTVRNLTHIRIIGLMGIATLTENTEQIRKEFRGLKTFFEKLKGLALPANIVMTELSMGMSNDFNLAIEEGTTMVRIGSAIFGQRDYSKTKI
jgi:PLP dependent protein